MTGQLTPDQLAEYLEITQEQFEELLRPAWVNTPLNNPVNQTPCIIHPDR